MFPRATDRLSLVTGGTKGIGAAICRAMRDAGYAVVAVYGHDDDAAHEFSRNHGISVRKIDVGDFESCRSGVAKIYSELGPVDILVNNAGIVRSVAIHNMPEESWHAVVGTNLTSCFNMCRNVIESMRERGFGRIVNISSVIGQSGQHGQASYAAAKSGLSGLTKSIAIENAANGITANIIAPGYIDTQMLNDVPPHIMKKILQRIPVGRLGMPEEIARCVVFLVSDDAGFITGTTLSINGGQHMI